MVISYLIVLIVVLVFVIYPFFYNYSFRHSKKDERTNDKDVDDILQHLHQKIQALINHVQLRRSLFNLTSSDPKNLIILQDYVLSPTTEKSYYNHNSKTIFLHVYDTSLKRFREYDVLMLEAIECICSMVSNYETLESVNNLRADLKNSIRDMKL